MRKTKIKTALTKRQAQVLNLSKQGVAIKDIAKQLGIVPGTVSVTLHSARKRAEEIAQRAQAQLASAQAQPSPWASHRVIINGTVYVRLDIITEQLRKLGLSS
jgi:DNA-binding CsgD family transcriptional regulator